MALSKLAVKRIEKLIEFMDSLPRSANKHFDMGSFFHHKGAGHEHQFGDFISRKDLSQCGTSACALGWAATMPAFKRIGLRISPVGAVSLKGSEGSVYSTIFGAFDFTDPELADNLFGGHGRIKTPKQWARHAKKELRRALTRD